MTSPTSNTKLSITAPSTETIIEALECYLSHLTREMEASAVYGSASDFTDDANKFSAAARVKRVMEQYLEDITE